VIIDIHAHLPRPGEYLTGLGVYDGRVGSLVEITVEAGVDRVVFSDNHATRADIPEDIVKGNEIVEEAVREFPDHIGGACVVDYRWPELSIEEFTRRVVEGRCSVVGEICSYHQGEVTRALERIVEEIVMHRVPMIFHASFQEDVAVVSTLAERYPEGTFILAHMGGMRGWKAGIEAASRFSNMYVDTSGIPLFIRGVVETAVRVLGAEKVLFATDFWLDDVHAAVQRIKKVDLPEDVKEKVWWKNWVALVGDEKK